MKWYALFVEAGEETTVKRWLDKSFNGNLKIIIPRRKLIERKAKVSRLVIRTIFSGYVFINVEMTEEVYYKIRNVPHVIKILSYNCNYTEISDEEMQPILNLVRDGDIIEFSDISIINSKLTVLSGPLKNNEDLIKKIDKRKKRATIYLDLKKEKKKIDLGVNIV